MFVKQILNINNVKISIIIPCYNMERYIEQTILSVINQDFENYELIVVDKCSSDKTLKIISKFEKYISRIISESDNGQYNAINKGMKCATGDVLAWLNADDIYFPWTLKHVGEFFNNYPEISWIGGIASLMDENGFQKRLNLNLVSKNRKFIENGWFRDDLFGFLQQEGMFWRKELWKSCNGLDEDYKLASDFDLWTRFSKKAELVSFGLPLASFRVHDNSRSKMQREVYINEVNRICNNKPQPPWYMKIIGSHGLIANQILRKLTFNIGKVFYYSVLKQKWILKNKITSMSHNTVNSM